jgi:hypothetical protein
MRERSRITTTHPHPGCAHRDELQPLFVRLTRCRLRVLSAGMRRQAKLGRPRTSRSFLAIDIGFYFLTHEWIGRWSRDASATSSLRFHISVLRFDDLLVVLVFAFFFGRHSLSPGTRSLGVSAQTVAQSCLIGPKRRRRRGSHRRAGRPPSSRFLLILQSRTEEDPVRHISPQFRPYWRNDRCPSSRAGAAHAQTWRRPGAARPIRKRPPVRCLVLSRGRPGGYLSL